MKPFVVHRRHYWTLSPMKDSGDLSGLFVNCKIHEATHTVILDSTGLPTQILTTGPVISIVSVIVVSKDL
jgi:hypothetical protein